MSYGPIYPFKHLADKACAEAEFNTYCFHEVRPVVALYDGNRLVRRAGWIVVDVNDKVSLMKQEPVL